MQIGRHKARQKISGRVEGSSILPIRDRGLHSAYGVGLVLDLIVTGWVAEDRGIEYGRHGSRAPNECSQDFVVLRSEAGWKRTCARLFALGPSSLLRVVSHVVAGLAAQLSRKLVREGSKVLV